MSIDLSGDVRAITIKQPYAWAVASGYKPTENRYRNVTYRGTVLIHAGRSWSKRGAEDPRVRDAAMRAAGGLYAGALLVLAGAPRVTPAGVILAVADLTGCHSADGCCKPWGDDEYERPGKAPVACHHLVLSVTHTLAVPVPCKGALGLWRPTPDVLAAVGTQLAEVAA